MNAWARMRPMGLTAAVFLGLGFWPVADHGAGIYKWVDENGRTHYLDSPPDESARQLDLPVGPDEQTVRSSRKEANRLLELDRRKQQARQRAKAREQREAFERKQEMQARQRHCARAKRDLVVLNQNAPVYWTNQDGERIFVEDDERAKRIAELEQIIKRYCGR